jgi:hypothetical protein
MNNYLFWMSWTTEGNSLGYTIYTGNTCKETHLLEATSHHPPAHKRSIITTLRELKQIVTSSTRPQNHITSPPFKWGILPTVAWHCDGKSQCQGIRRPLIISMPSTHMVPITHGTVYGEQKNKIMSQRLKMKYRLLCGEAPTIKI